MPDTAKRRFAGRPVSRVLSRAQGARTVIYLAGRLPGRSSSLPEGRNGPDQPCPLIWSCSRWGLPSQPVTRLLVGSYPAFSPLPRGIADCGLQIDRPRRAPSCLVCQSAICNSPRRYPFCCTFPVLGPSPSRGLTTASDGGRYPPPRPVEPGLSSPRSLAEPREAVPSRCGQRPSGRPADSPHYSGCRAACRRLGQPRPGRARADSA